MKNWRSSFLVVVCGLLCFSFTTVRAGLTTREILIRGRILGMEQRADMPEAYVDQNHVTVVFEEAPLNDLVTISLIEKSTGEEVSSVVAFVDGGSVEISFTVNVSDWEEYTLKIDSREIEAKGEF
ncbi:MAG: DUF3244 domain-containing protein [Dysgonamonadaceae bacterium]|nr:DUF3244 domain-containing protein [Dysgonamonadaceae bacterium]